MMAKKQKLTQLQNMDGVTSKLNIQNTLNMQTKIL